MLCNIYLKLSHINKTPLLFPFFFFFYKIFCSLSSFFPSLIVAQAGGPARARNMEAVGAQGIIRTEKANRVKATGTGEAQSQKVRLGGQRCG